MADQKLNIIFTGDVSQLNKAMQSAGGELTKFEQKLKESLGVEAFAQINQSVEQLRAKFASLQAIDIKANPQQALTAINEILADISKIKSSEILLNADNSDALADINQIQARLQDLKSGFVIKADLDTTKLEALLKPVSTTIAVNVSTKAAEAEIKALLAQVKKLKGQDILINLDGTQVIRTIDAIEKELIDLQAKLKTATNPADIAKLTQQLQLFKNSLSSNNVNQFSSSVNKAQQATFAFSQVLREAPSFAFSLQTGLLGISNNLPILADRFKEARASGLSTSNIFKEMAKGLVSLPGLMTIASTAAIFLAGAFRNSGKEAEDFSKDLKEVRNVLSDSTASTQGDIAKIQALANAFKNTEGSFKDQKKIIDELKKTNESYFGDLKAGVTTYEDITKAANAYTDALVAQAIVKGLQDAISDLARQLGEASIKYGDATKAADDQRKVLEKIKRENATVVQGQTAQNREVNLASNAYNKLQGNVLKAGLEVGKITQRIEDFRKQLNLAVLQSLDFKPLVKPDDILPKDTTDDIIARARAFVKQFGEVFVTPDLEESFTNTKDIIKKVAIKLLDDIENFRLRVRLPVQVITEADLQKDPEPLPREQLEALRQRYLDELQKEFQEPLLIDLTIQPAIDVQKAKERFRQAIKDADFEGALQAIDAKPQLAGFQELDQSIQTMAKSINETLTPAFQSFVDALITGQNPIKASFDSIVQSINQVIQKLIQAAIQAAILSAISGGSAGGFGKIFTGLLGFGGQANLGRGFIGGVGGSSAGGTLTARVSGTDLLFVLNQGGNIIGSTR